MPTSIVSAIIARNRGLLNLLDCELIDKIENSWVRQSHRFIIARWTTPLHNKQTKKYLSSFCADVNHMFQK